MGFYIYFIFLGVYNILPPVKLMLTVVVDTIFQIGIPPMNHIFTASLNLSCSVLGRG